MADLRFEWDPNKAASNARKHGVTFEEASSAFADEHALLIPDPDHSDAEDRFILLGLSSAIRLLVVVHVFLDADDVIRIISARKATRGESRQYGAIDMRDSYDFSKAKKNPYAKRLKKSVTIRLDASTVDYFKALAEETGVPYQTLINLYLRDCAHSRKKLSMKWTRSRERTAS